MEVEALCFDHRVGVAVILGSPKLSQLAQPLKLVRGLLSDRSSPFARISVRVVVVRSDTARMGPAASLLLWSMSVAERLSSWVHFVTSYFAVVLSPKLLFSS